jgi:hypothetical protein
VVRDERRIHLVRRESGYLVCARLESYELAKAIAGTTTHEAVLPVLANSQDMPATAGQVEALRDAGPLAGYLMAGHGLYAWGRDLAEARRLWRPSNSCSPASSSLRLPAGGVHRPRL